MRSRKILRFDVVSSLGQSCQVAYQMKRRGLRTKSGPFDWFTVPVPGLFSVLESGFQDFMKEENLTVVEDRGGKFVVRDVSSKIRSMHDFHAPMTIHESWPSFNEKMTRRVDAFKRDLADAPAVLFIRYGISRTDSLRLIELLRKMRNGKLCKLLALDSSFKENERPYDDDIISVHFPDQGNSWKGCNADWDRVLAGIQLTHSGLRQFQDRFNCFPVVEKIRKRIDGILRTGKTAEPL